MLDWRLISEVNPSIVWIRASPGQSERVAAELQNLPEAQSILLVTGEADIHTMLYPGSRERQRELLATTIPSTPGVIGVSSQLVLSAPRRGGDWTLEGALDEQQLAAVKELGEPGNIGDEPEHRQPTRLEHDVIRILFEDGRTSVQTIAERLGIARSTAQRAVRDVLASGHIKFRVDVEPQLLGLPLSALVAVHCAPRVVPQLLRSVSMHPATRIAVMTAGTASMMVHGSFRDEDALSRFLTEDLGAIPGVESLDVSIALGTYRRNWIDIDVAGRHTRSTMPPALQASGPRLRQDSIESA
jgi:DNA-binding Lrp family transcriptional regulator